MSENLTRAFNWLSWEAKRERSTKPIISNRLELMAFVVRETFRIVDGDPDIVIQELTFQRYLESKGADGLATMGECLKRGWIEPVADDGNCRKLRINETRLIEDDEEFTKSDHDGEGLGYEF